MQAQFDSGRPQMVDYTPGSAVSAGDVVVIGDHAFVAHLDIAAAAKGALAAGGGIYKVMAGEAIAECKRVWWDNTNNKVVETAAGNKFFGITIPGSSAAADEDYVYVLHLPNLAQSLAAAVVAAVSTADGSDAATTQALANALKTKVNAILTALKDAGLMASS